MLVFEFLTYGKEETCRAWCVPLKFALPRSVTALRSTLSLPTIARVIDAFRMTLTAAR